MFRNKKNGLLVAGGTSLFFGGGLMFDGHPLWAIVFVVVGTGCELAGLHTS